MFTPGSPPLAEGLRTLVVSPERFIEPGVTVRAAFSFTNVGGAPAKGVRARFVLPEGLTYLVDSAFADNEALDSLAGVGAIVKSGGADIGDVQPGAQRRISIAYIVSPTIENDTVIELQAAISSIDIPIIGSNIIRLIVRSKPNLKNEKTCVSLIALREPVPGADVTVSVNIRNVGESSASGVVLVMPTPIGTTYIPGSAQIDGVDFDDQKRREPFGYANPLTVARKLGPGASLTVQYHAGIDAAIPDGARIVARAAVSSAEISEFELPEASLCVSSSASFDGDQTRLELQTLDAHGYVALVTDEVRVGQRIGLRFIAHNSGTSTAYGVAVQFELPDGLTYAPGSLRLDGQPFPEPSDGMSVFLGDIAAHGTSDLTASAGVISPAPNGRALPVAVKLRWSNGSRAFSRNLSVISEPRFSRTRTSLRRVSPQVLEPGEPIAFEATIVNDGTTVAEEVLFELHADDRIEDIEVRDGTDMRKPKEHCVSLGSLKPQEQLRLAISGRVCYPIHDGAELRFGASVSAARCAPFELDGLVTLIRARPRFTPASSSLRLISHEPLRPDRVCAVAVSVRNEGNDRAHGVRIVLRHSPELRLETVEGATRDGSHIVFGDIDAGESREAVVQLRLIHVVPRGFIIDMHGVIVGRGLPPIVLDTVVLQTYAEPSFSDEGSFLSVPRDTVDAGAELRHALMMRNTGDGAAKTLVVKVMQPDAVTYVPGSTSINGRMLLDHHGASLLWSEHGLVLNDIAPGMEILIGWLSVVNSPLPPGTVVRAQASIAYDQMPEYAIASAPVVVRSAAIFSVAANELPFAVASTPALPIVRVQALPPLKNRSVLGTFYEPASLEARSALQVPERVILPLHLVTEFSQERLDRTLRFLKSTDLRSLLTHFLVLRAFFPGVADGSPHLDALLEETRGVLRETLNRLFADVRRLEIDFEHLEDATSRQAVVQLFVALGEELPMSIAPQRSGSVRIMSMLDPHQAQELATSLKNSPLGSVVPWYALAHLLGETFDYDGFHAGHIGAYRDTLIKTLKGFIPVPIGKFHHALAAERFPLLEEELQNVLSSFQEHAGVAG